MQVVVNLLPADMSGTERMKIGTGRRIPTPMRIMPDNPPAIDDLLHDLLEVMHGKLFDARFLNKQYFTELAIANKVSDKSIELSTISFDEMFQDHVKSLGSAECIELYLVPFKKNK